MWMTGNFPSERPAAAAVCSECCVSLHYCAEIWHFVCTCEKFHVVGAVCRYIRSCLLLVLEQATK